MERDRYANVRTSFVRRPSLPFSLFPSPFFSFSFSFSFYLRCLHPASCTPNNRERSFSPWPCPRTNCSDVLLGIREVMTEADDFPTPVITVQHSYPHEFALKPTGNHTRACSVDTCVRFRPGFAQPPLLQLISRANCYDK